MAEIIYDLCIIGGGINGAGIARDAASRGLSVLLVEAGDLASGTSSASSKLIHGGLRYLENYEFAMVRSALKERDLLLRKAPHLIHPIEIIVPQPEKAARPMWMIGLGLYLYDRLGGAGGRLMESRRLDLSKEETGKPLKSNYKRGFSYADGWGDDSRLVVLNAVDAASHGAQIKTRTRCQSLEAVPAESGNAAYWRVGLKDLVNTVEYSVQAAYVINATGPWAGQFLAEIGIGGEDKFCPKVKLVKGSHIVLPRQYEGDQYYLLQQADGRVVFVMPYEKNFTLIGTTEEGIEGDPSTATASDREVDYLIGAYNAYFQNEISKDDLLFTYSGVRPLLDDGHKNASKVTRDYRIYKHPDVPAPLWTIYGGKLTTYRLVAKSAVDKVVTNMRKSLKSNTDTIHLSGGGFPHADLRLFLEAQRSLYPWLPSDLLVRYAQAYGTRMDIFLFDKQSMSDMGRHFGEQLYEAEIKYMIEEEWAHTAEDALWRRSKLGLHVSNKTVDNLEGYFLSRLPSA